MSIAITLVPSLLFGVFPLLLGAFPTDIRRQGIAVMVGVGAVPLGYAAMLGSSWSLSATAWDVVCGFMWTGGQVSVLWTFCVWGVGRTMSLTTVLQLLLSTILDVSLFGEWHALGALVLGVVALAPIMLDAVACPWQERTDLGPTAAQRRDGLLATAASVILYGSYPSPLRAIEVPPVHTVEPIGLGLLAGAGLCVLIQPRRAPLRDSRIVPAASVGGLWAVGNALTLRSTAAVGVIFGLTLSQLGFVLATLGGLTILGEEYTGREHVAVAADIAATVSGLVLMDLATGMDTGASPSQQPVLGRRLA